MRRGLCINLYKLFFAVDLSSCSEDDYDSDDSERDLRLVSFMFSLGVGGEGDFARCRIIDVLL